VSRDAAGAPDAAAPPRASTRAIVLGLLALAALNVALSHEILWPTPLPVPDHRIAPELVWAWCGLLAWIAWRGRAGERVVGVFAAVLAAFAVMRYVDVVALGLFGRRVHLYWDGLQIPRFLSVAAQGAAGERAAALAAVAAVAALAWALYRGVRAAVRRVARDLAPAALRSRAALAATGCAVALVVANHAGVKATWPVVSRPVTPTWANQFVLLANALVPGAADRTLPPSPPLRAALANLAPIDLTIMMLESYGAVAFDDAAMHRELAPGRDALARGIAASGRGVVSAFFTSPTFGGASDLAHLTLLAGIDLTDPMRHDLLITTDRPTLARVLSERGWRSYGVYPALSWAWPESAFSGYDTLIDGPALGWRGPKLGYWRIPDQFSIARFEQMHPLAADDPPRFLFFATITSHVPFGPVPPLQPDRERLLSETPYDAADAERALAAGVDWLRLREGYVGTIRYTYDWLAGWVERARVRPETVVIVGDHQPTAAVTGEGARWDVPVHVVSDDAALLARLEARGFVRGLEPARASLGGLQGLTTTLLETLPGPATSASRDAAAPAVR
jgi:hypothetical protein